MDFKEFMKDNIVVLDGGMGTLLQKEGLALGEMPERWNISHPETVSDIHRCYFDAGSNVVCTNTFGASLLKFDEDELKKIMSAAVENARKAQTESSGKQQKYIALDIGPSGKLLKPYGDFDFEDAVSTFAKTITLGVSAGVDLILIETMSDSYETKAALLAAKENSDLPVIVSNAYGEDGKLLTGADPASVIAMLEGIGADAVGVNCSLGPKELERVISQYLEYASVPVLFKPNAGLPTSVCGKAVYDVSADEFAERVALAVNRGVRLAGGCCGTAPEYIGKLSSRISTVVPVPVVDKCITVASSYTHAVTFGKTPVLIGERLNPTGKKRLKQALVEHDTDYILAQGIAQQEAGAHILDVNVGLPEINEAEILCKTVSELQAVTDLPLQIDTSDSAAMEKAVRRYNGKPIINSVNGKAESMSDIFPIAKKYGGLVVALTLDENGIPDTAQGRVAIAENIINTAASYGIAKKNLIFDTLAMTVSAQSDSAKVALDALRMIRSMGCNTSLGVSNISFGLPCRDIVNSTFFTLALGCGLSAAIMNPSSIEMMKAYRAFLLLDGKDKNCADYITFAGNLPLSESVSVPEKKSNSFSDCSDELGSAIVKGLKSQAASLTRKMLTDVPALEIINGSIIPALDIAGKGYEEKQIYLPQLLICAEAAKNAFEIIKAEYPKSDAKKCRIVLATVKGDIHDIGKNIVKLLLENYGFDVLDLGRDVPPEKIVSTVIETSARIAGLSALMTTTVPSMEETIRLIKCEAPWCKVVVGGAVLTKEYADSIGADKYAKDAMETVRYAESIDQSGK